MSEFALPMLGGMYLRDAINGEITDADTDADGNHQVQVRFPHDTVDTYKTTFGRDAFKESFAARKPTMCWQHDLRDPIGHAVKAQATRNANEIIGRFSDLDRVPNAGRAYAQIDDGTITDFSFGFRKPKFEKHPRIRGVRNIAHAQMIEFSPVTIGSIPGAVATGLREEDLMNTLEDAHSMEEIRGLVEAEIITPEQAKAYLARSADWAEVLGGPGADSSGGGGVRVGFETPEGSLDDDEVEFRNEEMEIPDTLGAGELVELLPDAWRQAFDGHTIHVAPPGMEVSFREAGAIDPTESAGEIAQAMAAAAEQATDFLREVDRDSLDEHVRDALDLYEAMATSSGSLLEVLGVRDGSSPYSQPGNPDGSENMGPHQVTCDQCGGTGQIDDAGDSGGSICPKCGGSGVEAITRADMPQDAPDDAAPCLACRATGQRNDAVCFECEGRGWMSPEEYEEYATRADGGSFSDKPWSDFPASKYTPEQYKRACLVSTGDNKADCHLPVKEPDGTVNKNGVHAAASRLASTNLPDDLKRQAANKLKGLYSSMGEDAPDGVTSLSTREDLVETIRVPDEIEETASLLDGLLERGERGRKRVTDEAPDNDPDDDGDDDETTGGSAAQVAPGHKGQTDKLHTTVKTGGSGPSVASKIKHAPKKAPGTMS